MRDVDARIDDADHHPLTAARALACVRHGANAQPRSIQEQMSGRAPGQPGLERRRAGPIEWGTSMDDVTRAHREPTPRLHYCDTEQRWSGATEPGAAAGQACRGPALEELLKITKRHLRPALATPDAEDADGERLAQPAS
jgi:hypothetical protein